MACNNESNFNFIKFIGKQKLCLNTEQAELLANIITACNEFESFTYEDGIITICLMVDGELVCKTIDLNGSGIDTDEKVKVSLNDTTAGYLNGKLVAGTGVLFTENNDGSDETLTIGLANTSNKLVYGGIVSWLQSYDFEVTAAGYYINGQFYTSPYTVVTLSPADPTLDRIDVIYVDDTGVVGVKEGVPSLVPAQPGLDLGTQLGLGIVLVEAGSTQPGTGFNIECGYLENGEWTAVSTGVDINVASNADPYAGFTSIEATSVVDGETVTLTRSTPFVVQQDFNIITFKLKSKALWAATEKLILSFRLAGVQVGNTITLGDGDFGFDSSNVTDYQTISIPLQSFGFVSTATVDEFHIEVEAVNAFGWFLDNLCLQGGIFNNFPLDDDIHNQYFGPQTPGRFWIRGTGRADGWFTSPQRIGTTENFYIGTEKFGLGAWADNNAATIIGALSEGHGNNGSVVVGAQCSATNGIAIGWGTLADTCVVVGGGGYSVAFGGVGIGNGVSQPGGHSSVAIGGNASTTGIGSMALGYNAANGGFDSISIGVATVNNFGYSSAYGANAITTAEHQMVYGGEDVFSDYGFWTQYWGTGVTSTFRHDRFWTITGSIGTNIPGDTWIFAGAKATGNAPGGTFEWQTSDAGASGTTLQSLTTKMGLNSNTKGLYLDNVRFQMDEGTDVVSAGDITLGTGNTFTITGNNTVNAITNTNWQEGALIRLHLTGTPTLKHNTAGGAGTTALRLAGAVDFVVSGYSVIELELKDGFWNEVGRTIATGGGSGIVSADSGVHLSTATNVRLGGDILENTEVDYSGFDLVFGNSTDNYLKLGSFDSPAGDEQISTYVDDGVDFYSSYKIHKKSQDWEAGDYGDMYMQHREGTSDFTAVPLAKVSYAQWQHYSTTAFTEVYWSAGAYGEEADTSAIDMNTECGAENTYTRFHMGYGGVGSVAFTVPGIYLQTSTNGTTYKGIFMQLDGDMDFQNYPTSRNDGSTTKAFYVDDANGSLKYGTISASITADNGLTATTSTNVQLGGTFIQNTNIANANFTLSLNADAAQTNNIFQTKNSAAAIRARITKDAAFSNTGGQAGSEVFGDGATVVGVNTVIFGNTSSSSGANDIVIGSSSSVGNGGANIVVGFASSVIGGYPGNVIVGTQTSTTSNRNSLVGNQTTSTGRSTGIGFNQTFGGAGANVAVGEQTNVQHDYGIAFGFAATTTAANQVIFGGTLAGGFVGTKDYYFGSGVQNISGGFIDDVTFNITGSFGTDIAAKDFYINGGKATGNSTDGGNIFFKTSDAGSTGTTLQSLSNKMVVSKAGVVGIGKYSGLTATRLEVVDNSVGAASIMKLTSTSTAAASNSQKMMEITQSGANASQVTYGIHGTNSHSGAGSTNYGIFYTASGADTNYGVAGVGSTYGVLGSSTGSSGVYGENTSSGVGVTGTSTGGGIGGKFISQGAAATGIVSALTAERTYGGTTTNDVGAALDYNIQTDDGFRYQAARIASTFTDVTTASRKGNLEFYTTDSASSTLKLEISSAGIFTIAQGLSDYADDSAASAGGIPVNGLYRTGSAVKIRVS